MSQSPPGSVNAPNNTGIITQGQSGGQNTIINPPAPRADNRIYQDGQAVAMIDGASVNEAAKKVSFNTVWNSDTLDYKRPIEFRKYVLRVVSVDLAGRTLLGMAPNGQMGTNITPGMECAIIGSR